MTTNPSVNYEFCNYYSTRQRAALTNIPPSRVDSLALSPYPAFTPYQIAMRRKVEILKYEANKTNTKTNNLTKAEKWNKLVNKSYQSRTYSNELINSPYISTTPDNCNYIPTPSTACDIPGPLVYLQEDPNVPLYNYKNITNIGIINTEDLNLWQLTTTPNVLTQSSTISIPSITNERYNGNTYGSLTITSMYLQNFINSSYTYTINTPIGLYGFLKKNTSYSNLNIDISMNIQDIQLVVKYAGSNVILQKIPVITPISGFNSMNININTTLAPNTEVIATQYVGNLNISNLFLYTQPGYLYDITLNFKMGYNVPSNLYQYFNSLTLKAIANMDSPSSNFTNCSIYNPTSISGFLSASLSGI